MSGIQERWLADVRAGGATADLAALRAAGDDLIRRWAEPHRRYHDTRHLAQVLDALDAVIANALDPAAVRLAAWFHDAVYAGAPGEDERASAELACSVLDRLGVPVARVAEVDRLVRLTACHDPSPDDVNGAALCDADLAILAAEPGEYAGYADRVRQEYAYVPEAQFRAGRAAVLRRLLAAPPLYRTAAGARWEPAAQANVEAELRLLEGDQ